VGGVVYGTFAEAARERGLIDDRTGEYARAMTDAIDILATPAQLRRLFVALVSNGAFARGGTGATVLLDAPLRNAGEGATQVRHAMQQDYFTANLAATIPSFVTDAAVLALMSGCFTYGAAKRPSTAEIVQATRELKAAGGQGKAAVDARGLVLCVGVETYAAPSKSLRGVRAETQRAAQFWRDAGAEVVELLDPDVAQLNAQLVAMRDRLQQSGDKVDYFVLQFSKESDGGEHVVCATDGRVKRSFVEQLLDVTERAKLWHEAAADVLGLLPRRHGRAAGARRKGQRRRWRRIRVQRRSAVSHVRVDR
jgi:hypothetical protein